MLVIIEPVSNRITGHITDLLYNGKPQAITILLCSGMTVEPLKYLVGIQRWKKRTVGNA